MYAGLDGSLSVPPNRRGGRATRRLQRVSTLFLFCSVTPMRYPFLEAWLKAVAGVQEDQDRKEFQGEPAAGQAAPTGSLVAAIIQVAYFRTSAAFSAAWSL